jgi:hypothetical protein
MYLYNLTLQRPTAITHAVHGAFSGTRQQEIVISRGNVLELLKPDVNTGKVHVAISVEIFGVIRSLMAFRLTGGNKGMFCTSLSKRVNSLLLALMKFIVNIIIFYFLFSNHKCNLLNLSRF